MDLHELALTACLFIGAMLYSSVGHGGSSAYIAMMALFGVQAAVMRPTALVLNVIVSSLGSFRFIKAGYFRWRVLWPFLITAVPMATLGGMLSVPGHVYKWLVGAVLWAAAVRMLWPAELPAEHDAKDPPVLPAMLIGAGIGLLSGITGTGGGIFLSPVILLMRWSPVKQTSGIAAVFILANSLAGLAGNPAALDKLPPELPVYAAAVLAGGLVGTTFGIRLQGKRITTLLGLVLIVAGAKLFGVY